MGVNAKKGNRKPKRNTSAGGKAKRSSNLAAKTPAEETGTVDSLITGTILDLDARLSELMCDVENRLRQAVDGGNERARSVTQEVRSSITTLEASLERTLNRLDRGPVEHGAGRQGAFRALLDAGEALTGKRPPWGRPRVLSGITPHEIDEFGYEAPFEAKIKPLFEFLYRKYWRIETVGIENVPEKGRALLVANHSGMIPYDGIMIRTAVALEHPSHRMVRWMVEDFAYHFPFMAPFVSRIGGVRACQENAERLLGKDALVLAFPEGIRGSLKSYRERYQLQRFGRGGFIRLCMATGSPIIPVAVIGAEEIHPVVARADWLARPLGLKALPITPTLPFLGPLGLVPLPSKWHIHFGEPIQVGKYGLKSIENHILVNKLTQKVRDVIQEMIKESLKKRRSPFFG